MSPNLFDLDTEKVGSYHQAVLKRLSSHLRDMFAQKIPEFSTIKQPRTEPGLSATDWFLKVFQGPAMS
jgi:hypothetical protein